MAAGERRPVGTRGTGGFAVRSYRPKVYPGELTLFRAANLGRGRKHDPQMGWARLAGGGLKIHVIPGYHAHIVLEPRVRLLAKKVAEALARAHEVSQTKDAAKETARDETSGTNVAEGRA